MRDYTRRDTIALGLGTGLAVTMLDGTARAVEPPAPGVTFTLLLVNDIYRAADVGGRGGFSRLAAVVAAERARGVPVLFAHAGDTFSPSLLSGFDQGEHIVHLTNMIRPDVFVPGNHEFDFGRAVYAERVAQSRFPYFAANLREPDGRPVAGHRDHALFDLGGIKVGVVGLALAGTPHMSQSGDLVFTPELDTLRREAGLLRAAGAEFLVAVAHTDRDMDRRIAGSGLVDVLLSGHDHDLAIGYDGTTVMVESNEDGNYVTAVDIAATVTVKDGTRKLTWVPSFRVHDSRAVTPDPAVEAEVRRLEAQLSAELDVGVGTAGVELDSRTVEVRSRETTMGDLVADAIRDATGADCALTNGGGIRANKVYAPGTRLTRRDILSELPFGNTTVLVELSGADLRAALENGVSLLGQTAGRFPQVSGLSVTIDAAKPAGQRIVAVRVGDQVLDPHRRYRVASNNFMLVGGDGYTAFRGGRVLIGATDGTLLANTVMAYVRKLGTVRPVGTGRISFV